MHPAFCSARRHFIGVGSLGSPRGPRTTGPFGTCSGLLGEIAARPPEKAVLRRAPARQASPPLRVAPPFRRVMLSADWRPSTTEKQRPAPLLRSSECCSPRQTERQFPGGYALLGGVQKRRTVAPPRTSWMPGPPIDRGVARRVRVYDYRRSAFGSRLPRVCRQTPPVPPFDRVQWTAWLRGQRHRSPCPSDAA